ncbi:modulator of macroautophagy TMEM150B isoform X1 [Callithrix jacchus]
MWGRLSLMPAFLAVWAISGVWIVFAIAVANRTVDLSKGFPYISFCGSFPPQSCIFSQVLNVGAALAAWICIVRYHQLRDWGVGRWPNQLILWTGLLCALGTSVVGNFQERNQRPTHLAGAFLAFVLGNVYFWLQLLLWRLKSLPQPGAAWIGPLRLGLCSFCTILIVASILLVSRERVGGGSSLELVFLPGCVSLGTSLPFSELLSLHGIMALWSRVPTLRSRHLGWNPLSSTSQPREASPGCGFFARDYGSVIEGADFDVTVPGLESPVLHILAEGSFPWLSLLGVNSFLVSQMQMTGLTPGLWSRQDNVPKVLRSAPGIQGVTSKHWKNDMPVTVPSGHPLCARNHGGCLQVKTGTGRKGLLAEAHRKFWWAAGGLCGL